jgi:acetyl-CoA carboxylase carboxyl transferase subunit alpha
VKEPMGGAHRDAQRAISQAGKAIDKALGDLDGLSAAELKRQRRERFYAIGREGLN